MSTNDKQPNARSVSEPEQKFSELSSFGKIAHVGKVIIFFLSFGFAFPSILSD